MLFSSSYDPDREVLDTSLKFKIMYINSLGGVWCLLLSLLIVLGKHWIFTISYQFPVSYLSSKKLVFFVRK